MKRIAFCCLLLAGMFIHIDSFSQIACTPDTTCSPDSLICPSSLPSACIDEPYNESLTISLGATIAGFPLTDVTLDSITGFPNGMSSSCNPANCVFPANSQSCILISGTPTEAGTFPLRGYMRVNVGIVVAIDTPVGVIIVVPKDCNGDCGGTATIDGCGICSGGNTGVLPNCDDGDLCTLDDCGDILGECLNVPNTCDDGDPCTTDNCDAGNCQNTLINCDDSDQCTNDACINGTCEHTPAVFANTSHAVDVSGMAFSPQNIIITVGDTVVWNATDGLHNVNGSTSTFPSNPESFFNGAPAASPWTFSYVFTIAGIYNYQCDVHFSMGMFGSITVNEAIDCTPDTICPHLAFDYNFPCEGETGTVTNISTDVDSGATYYLDLGADGSIDFTIPASDFPVDSSFTVGAGTTTFSVIVVNSTGCSDTLTQTVTTPEKPQLDLSFSASPCEGEAVTVTNLSTGVDSGATYYLDVNSNGTINLIIPASDLPGDSTLVLPVPPGVTGFTVYVVNSTGCSDTLVSSVTVLDKPELNMTFSASPCEGEAVTVTNLSTGVDSGATYYLDVNSNGTINLIIPASDLPGDSTLVLPFPPGVTGFTVYVVNSTGCSDTLVSSVTVLDKPELNMTFSASPCEGEAVTVTNLSTGVDSGATYYLDVNSNGTINLIIPASDLPGDSTLVLPVPPGVTGFTVYVVNSTGCSDTLVSSVTVLDKPELAFDYQNICEGDTTYITNLSTGVDSGAVYSLDLYSDGSIDLTLPASALPSDSALFVPITGSIDFTVYVTNANGCSDTLVASILVASCDDGNPCTIDSCSEAQCFNTPIICDDGDSCTTDLCDLGQCSYIPIPGCGSGDPCDTMVCDDLEPCTLDECNFGQCVFTIISCDDSDDCTTDECIQGQCLNTPVSCDDSDDCTTDECIQGQCLNTPLDCDDFDPCTDDGCVAGQCVSTPMVCDDQDACTIDECINGTCEFTPITCDDLDACTNDACVNGLCEFTPVVCDDQDACTNDACVNGQCEFTPVLCDDSDGCTSDACINGQCEYVPVVCDDQDACTVDECANGQCQFTPVVCDDQDGCTNDACLNGLCDFTAVNCDDADDCTVDICQNGQCQYIPLDCTDGDPCTNDVCQGGQCSNVPVDCSDGDACTDDLCVNGNCFNQPVNCDDGNPCTSDFCDAAGACQNTPIPGCCLSAADCDDANGCTDDVCNGGLCLHISTCCDDQDLCTIDVCDPTDGQCDFIALYCDDGDPCTDDGCTNGNCTHTPVNCDDQDICTTDECVNGNCIHTPQNCDDGDPCTTDFCDANGVCQHLPIVCDDFDLCTSDSCVQGVCVYIPMLCDDADLCTVDKCVLGTCVFTALDCDDFDPCTNDYCIGGNCFHDAIAGCCVDAAQCDDGDACTDDACTNNVCENTAIFTDITIEESNLPPFCQGSGVLLNAVSSTASSYSWSTGETTQSIQVAASGTYSVTAVGPSGCAGSASYSATFDASSLLSSYVIVAKKQADFSQNTVYSGGIGVTANAGKAKFKNNSVVTAAGTFVKADLITVSGGSTVTTQTPTEASLTLPLFETNPSCALGQDIQIPNNSTVTLNGSLYNGITIGVNCNVTFTAPDINVENIFTKSNTTIRFTSPCVKLRVCKKLQLGGNNTFNPDSADVIAFVAQDVTVGAGSTVFSDIYMSGGKMTVLSASSNDPNEFTGLFMVNVMQAGANTNWHQNPTCNPACNTPSVPCQGNDNRVVSFTLVNANTDQDMGTLTDGAVIDICQTPVNIRANVCDDQNIESVRFQLDGTNFRMENIPFYTIAGDNNGNYLPWNIAPGTYTIKAIPYTGNNGTGTAGIDLEVTITVVCSAPRLSNPNQTMATEMLDRSVMLKGYPNVFSDKLNIEFSLPEQSRVTLDIIDISGNKIAELFNGTAEEQKLYNVEFDGSNTAGGVIIYRLQTEHGVYYDKAIVVKD